jgi:hypothetical protein
MAGWTDEELRNTIAAYLTMLDAELLGERYSKAKVRRKLVAGPLSDRSEQSIEYRMRNISTVLADHGRPTLSGYVAAKNVGSGVGDRIWQILSEFKLPSPKMTKLEPVDDHPEVDGLPRKAAPIIYFNVGWMREYAGPDPSDPTTGNHGYLGQHSHGAEANNFVADSQGYLHGYRPPGSREQVNIDRLGAAASDAYIDGVTVVWMAREPASKVTVVVGWYLNARVYRTAQDGEHTINGETHSWSAEALAGNATLVPAPAREFRIQSSRTAPGAGFGQKPTWYGATSVNRRVLNYISRYRAAANSKRPATKGSPPKRPPRNNDPELRRKVERAAVDHATKYYEQLYGLGSVETVEALARGWDLEIQTGAGKLLVEVKGLLRGELVCELTPNEYQKMMARENRRQYVIYVVNNALALAPDVPLPSVFEHVKGNVWQTQDGRTLKMTEKVGAVLTCD